MTADQLKQQLDFLYKKYNRPHFITDDPISIPHRYSRNQDIEISAFFSAILAWGQRKTIINSLTKLMALMDHAPFDYVLNHMPAERKRFNGFVHRTFQDDDLIYFIEFLQHHYQQSTSLESLFTGGMSTKDLTVERGLIHFHSSFFSLPHLGRTEKHISTPAKKSACKRMNLFLRWMVRYDTQGVDFGLWKEIKPAQLICPLDVHVHKAALKLRLTHRKQADWTTALEVTAALRKLDKDDPVKYDYALFGYSHSGL